ncbi:adhesion regulating molecule region protein, partial [Cystoisospora suis]
MACEGPADQQNHQENCRPREMFTSDGNLQDRSSEKRWDIFRGLPFLLSSFSSFTLACLWSSPSLSLGEERNAKDEDGGLELLQHARGRPSCSSGGGGITSCRAGKCRIEGSMVSPDTRKGRLQICEGEDGLTHVQWINRENQRTEDDLIVINDAYLERVP